MAEALEPLPEIPDYLTAAARLAYEAVDWDAAACAAHWLPSQAWNPDGWGNTPVLTERSPREKLLAASIRRKIPIDVSPLVMASRLHMYDVPSFVEIGRRSPCVRLAVEVCATCPIQVDCLEYAIASPTEKGTWGGVGDRGRRDERSRRRRVGHHRS